MKVYRTDEIRNVVLLGHGGSGKTSLVEAMAFVSGVTNRMGKISDHNTLSDLIKKSRRENFPSIQRYIRLNGKRQRSMCLILRDISTLSGK